MSGGKLGALVAAAESRTPIEGCEEGSPVVDAQGQLPLLYHNRHGRLNIDFQVHRLPFEGLQTLDPRVLTIAPGCNNERHRHAHESLFVVLSGTAIISVGEREHPLERGQVAFVPRWAFHQTHNASDVTALVMLAITDFGFTSAVLGDYDRRTRRRFSAA